MQGHALTLLVLVCKILSQVIISQHNTLQIKHWNFVFVRNAKMNFFIFYFTFITIQVK